jgi:GNAT superfamily N-acetyltransferase
MALPITRLAAPDLDDCLELAADRGWQPERRKWALMFELGEVYGIRDPAGGLAGSVTLTRYGRELAVVGMMLVAARHERRGLGGRLMARVLAEAGDATVFLYATSFGRPLYERLGFRAIGELTTALGRFTGAPAGGSRPAEARDGGAIAALDTAAVGADRARLVTAYLQLADQVRVVERDGAVCGYAALAPGGGGSMVVGPVIAPDLDAARTLIADLASGIDAPVRLDIEHRHDGLREWARERGVKPHDDAVLMVHGARELPGARRRLVLPMTLALG